MAEHGKRANCARDPAVVKAAIRLVRRAGHKVNGKMLGSNRGCMTTHAELADCSQLLGDATGAVHNRGAQEHKNAVNVNRQLLGRGSQQRRRSSQRRRRSPQRRRRRGIYGGRRPKKSRSKRRRSLGLRRRKKKSWGWRRRRTGGKRRKPLLLLHRAIARAKKRAKRAVARRRRVKAGIVANGKCSQPKLSSLKCPAGFKAVANGVMNIDKSENGVRLLARAVTCKCARMPSNRAEIMKKASTCKVTVYRKTHFRGKIKTLSTSQTRGQKFTTKNLLNRKIETKSAKLEGNCDNVEYVGQVGWFPN